MEPADTAEAVAAHRGDSPDMADREDTADMVMVRDPTAAEDSAEMPGSVDMVDSFDFPRAVSFPWSQILWLALDQNRYSNDYEYDSDSTHRWSAGCGEYGGLGG